MNQILFKFKLSKKQKAFCEEYIIDSNATAAAVRAGYNIESVEITGKHNLMNPHIQAYIQQLRAGAEINFEFTREMAIEYCDELRPQAVVKGNLELAIKVDALLAKIAGIFNEKSTKYIEESFFKDFCPSCGDPSLTTEQSQKIMDQLFEILEQNEPLDRKGRDEFILLFGKLSPGDRESLRKRSIRSDLKRAGELE